MKKIRPGQFYWHNKVLLKAAKRTNGCQGCVLNSIVLCPNIMLSNSKNQEIPNCETNDIIFVKC